MVWEVLNRLLHRRQHFVKLYFSAACTRRAIGSSETTKNTTFLSHSNTRSIFARSNGPSRNLVLQTKFFRSMMLASFAYCVHVVPDSILDENHKGEERMRHVTVNVEGRNLLRQHQHIPLVSLLQVSFHPLQKAERMVSKGEKRLDIIPHFLRVADPRLLPTC